jgi:hypothetical protein
VAALFTALFAQLAHAVVADGLTIDEVVYIGAGYAHLKGDFRLNPEQPPVSKMIGALGLQGLGSPRGLDAGEWDYGYAFVQRNTIPASAIIARARTGAVVLTLLLGLAVWGWARSAYGPGAALLALAILAFHPSILAHGHLDTTDLPGTLTMFLGSLAFWRWSERPSTPRAALVGLLVGLAVATRITSWLLLPAFVLLEAFARRPWKERAKVAVLILALTPFVIWAVYDFRAAPSALVLRAGEEAPPATALDALGRFVGSFFPDAYVDGIRDVVEHNRGGHPAYLLGEMSTTGWPYYYLVAFLVKNTPGFLLGTLGALVALARRRSFGRLEAHLLVPAALMAALASLGHIQIGERYILPIYPYLIVLIASLLPRLGFRRVVIPLVLVLHLGPALAEIPRGYVPYFNLLAGGTDGAYRVLVDSNLDWGQDLPRLARYMKDRGIPKIQLGYHGSDNPDRFGIVRDDLPGARLYAGHAPAVPFRGTVVVSPNIVEGVITFGDADPYGVLRERTPDDHAGVFLVYRFPPEESPGPP